MAGKGRFISVIGFVATVVGFGAQLMGDWVAEKRMDEMIDMKLDEALAKRDDKRLMLEDGNDDEDEEE